jgi:hypothetical protein
MSNDDFERDLPDDDREFREWCRRNRREGKDPAMTAVATGEFSYPPVAGVDRRTILTEVERHRDLHEQILGLLWIPSVEALRDEAQEWVEWLRRGVTSPFVAPWPEFIVDCKIKVSGKMATTPTEALDHVHYLIDEYIHPGQGVEYVFASARRAW